MSLRGETHPGCCMQLQIDRSYFNNQAPWISTISGLKGQSWQSSFLPLPISTLWNLEGARAARPQASGEPGSSVVLLGPHPHARDVVAHIAATNAKTRRR